jgi:3-phenylpropionate/trans-cinnamate dioxygenase ferredoxin component
MAKLVKIAETKDLTPARLPPSTWKAKKSPSSMSKELSMLLATPALNRGGPLSEGSVAGTTVTCPWHGADFDLKIGAVMRPPARQGVPSYRVVIDGGEVKIEI